MSHRVPFSSTNWSHDQRRNCIWFRQPVVEMQTWLFDPSVCDETFDEFKVVWRQASRTRHGQRGEGLCHERLTKEDAQVDDDE